MNGTPQQSLKQLQTEHQLRQNVYGIGFDDPASETPADERKTTPPPDFDDDSWIPIPRIDSRGLLTRMD